MGRDSKDAEVQQVLWRKKVYRVARRCFFDESWSRYEQRSSMVEHEKKQKGDPTDRQQDHGDQSIQARF